MQIKLRTGHQDFWAGLMFMALGAIAVYVAQDYPMGKAMRMGPGYFPTHLGYLLLILGAFVTGRSFFSEPAKEERVTRWARLPLVLMPLSVVMFAILVDNLGLVIAVAVLILFASASVRNFRPLEMILMYLVLLGIALGVFMHSLGVPFHAFWEESLGKALRGLVGTVTYPLTIFFGR
jgi:hypothetical protein